MIQREAQRQAMSEKQVQMAHHAKRTVSNSIRNQEARREEEGRTREAMRMEALMQRKSKRAELQAQRNKEIDEARAKRQVSSKVVVLKEMSFIPQGVGKS